jgi:hypothetical protein
MVALFILYATLGHGMNCMLLHRSERISEDISVALFIYDDILVIVLGLRFARRDE